MLQPKTCCILKISVIRTDGRPHILQKQQRVLRALLCGNRSKQHYATTNIMFPILLPHLALFPLLVQGTNRRCTCWFLMFRTLCRIFADKKIHSVPPSLSRQLKKHTREKVNKSLLPANAFKFYVTN